MGTQVDVEALPHGRAIEVGKITTKDDAGEQTYPMALVIEFKSAEDIRAALQQGACRFEVL